FLKGIGVALSQFKRLGSLRALLPGIRHLSCKLKMAALGIKKVSLTCGFQQALMGVLSVNIDQAFAQLTQLTDRNWTAVNVAAAAALTVDDAPQDQHAVFLRNIVFLKPARKLCRNIED